jgi:hypothetical protein
MKRSPVRLALGLAPVVLLASAPATAQIHKCTDPSGRISYSDAPCPGAGTQLQAGPASTYQGRDRFLKDLVAIARHGSMGDIGFVEKTLGVRIERKPQGKQGQTLYDIVPPAGSPASRIAFGVQAGTGGYMQFTVDPSRQCIAPSQVVAAFGTPQNDSASGEDRELIFEIQGGPHSTLITAYVAQRPAACARLFRLQVGYPK